jgi:hypothetical protein
MFGFLKRLFAGWAKSDPTPQVPEPTPQAPEALQPHDEPLAFEQPAFEQPVIVQPEPVQPEPIAPAPVFTPAPPPPEAAMPEAEVPAPPVFTPAPVAAPAPEPQPAMLLGADEPLLPGDSESFGMVQSIGNPNAFMIGLTGEQDHQWAINALREGIPVTLELEADNPHDNAAIAAVDLHGRVIGYIGHDSWLREAIYGSGVGFTARVLATEMGSQGYREVVLEVEPSEEPLRERRYQRPPQP